MKNDFEIRGDKAVIFLKRMDGSLLETTIDLEDLDKAKQILGSWYAWEDKFTKAFYARSSMTVKESMKSTYLHRLVTNCPKGLQVDHMNHQTLNNTKENLRIVNHSQNGQNRKKAPITNTSGVMGVVWHKVGRKWLAQLCLNQKHIYLGLYTDINEAADVVERERLRLMKWYIS